MAENTSEPTIADLEAVIRTLPIIDNHAHNIYRPEGLRSEELIGITSEASRAALEDASTTLAHLRCAKMLKKPLGLPRSASWQDVLQKRRQVLDSNPEQYLRKCFEGSQTLLLDDKYAEESDVEDYSWHDRFTLSPCKRIERIEVVASEILEDMHKRGELLTGEGVDKDPAEVCWQTFVTEFKESIMTSINDSEVVGFKSIICYMTGLDVEVDSAVESASKAMVSFHNTFLPTCVEQEFEITIKPINDFLVIYTCDLLKASHSAKPFQFHTGLGDNDISILRSNSSYLQPLIAAYETVQFVLLHSAYPYTREAGYLSSVYKNCYLDLGLVWPELSRDGQETAIREALELTPWSKLLWSTDGNYMPETYYLANVQGRAAMERVMKEYVREDDLSVEEAIQAVKAIYFENSNRLYGLGLKVPALPGCD